MVIEQLGAGQTLGRRHAGAFHQPRQGWQRLCLEGAQRQLTRHRKRRVGCPELMLLRRAPRQ